MKMKSALPFVAMVISQVAQVGLTLAAKKAIGTGMHNFSYAFYSNAIASLLLLLPASFLTHRSSNRPSITLSAVGGFLLLGILGFMLQVVGYVGMSYASATEVSAILNLIPGFTFVFAIIFGVERLGHGGLAKIIGTLISVVGAIIVTLFTGPAIISPSLTSFDPQHLLGQQSLNFVIGGLLMLVNGVLAALLIVTQALLLKKFSAVLIVMLAYSSFISVLSLVTSLILEHDLNQFSLLPKTRLLAILYSGCFGGVFQLTIAGWCMKMKGPLFVAIFQPLGIVIAAILGVLFLGDGLYLGCIIGSAIIVIGFYGVIWGKTKEDTTVEASIVDSLKSHLLQENIAEQNVV